MKIFILVVILFLPITCMGQIFGLGVQTSKSSNSYKLQFNTSISAPYYNDINHNLCSIVSMGIDYVSGGSTVSGLNLKPIMFATTTPDILGGQKYTLMVGADTGYNINFQHGHSGIILTPNIYFDYKVFYIKVGYDYNTFHNEGQFFIKTGVGLGLGFFKMFNPRL